VSLSEDAKDGIDWIIPHRVIDPPIKHPTMANLLAIKRTTIRGRGAPQITIAPTQSHPEGFMPALVNPDLTNPQTSVFTERIVLSDAQRRRVLGEMREVTERLPELQIVRSVVSTYSFKEMKEQAVATIDNLNPDGYNSVNDPRMGVVGKGICIHCSKIDCIGHYGIIVFKYPIYNPIFLREIIAVLGSICNCCGCLLLDKEKLVARKLDKLADDKRLMAIEKASQGINCDRDHSNLGENVEPCKPNPTYITSNLKSTNAVMYKLSTEETEFLARSSVNSTNMTNNSKLVEDVLNILDKIPDEDARLLGFSNGSHPRNMILQGIIVMPPVARPPVRQGGVIEPDPLTRAYVRIIKANLDLQKVSLAADQGRPYVVQGKVKTIEMARQDLFDAVQHLVVKTDSTSTKRGQDTFQSITDLLTGKGGAFRNIIMGKRGNYCARTVLGPDPSLKFGQLSVPRVMAHVLTKQVRITDINKKAMEFLLNMGRLTHIVKASGLGKGLREQIKPNSNIKLEVGNIVHRWLQDGDRVAFNRQPTLHKQSMMSYEVVLVDRLTFGLHISYCTPHNAD